jgi:hypothetical protein
MRPLSILGLVVLLFGILSFFVPVPVSNTHEIKSGDASIGITTRHHEILPPAVGGVLCAVGAVLLIVGTRKATA